MKIGMFVTKQGKVLYQPICAACSRVIENVNEANLCPREDRLDNPKPFGYLRNGAHVSLQTDDLEVYHWACDEGGVPWVNLGVALSGMKPKTREAQTA